jgi:hypothetical protein
MTLIYPLRLPVAKEHIKFHEFIPCTNVDRMKDCSLQREAYVEAMNSDEVSLTNLNKVINTGRTYLGILAVMREVCDVPNVPIRMVPIVCWQSGMLSSAPFTKPGTFKNFRDIVHFETIMVATSLAYALVDTASKNLIGFKWGVNIVSISQA